MGHEDQFRPPRVSARSAFREETFAGRFGNEKMRRRHGDIAICRMLPVRLLKERHRLARCTVRIHGDRIDIGIARIVRHPLVCATQQMQRSGLIPVAHQIETERILDVGIVGLDRHRLFQQLSPLHVPAARPLEVGEVDERRHKIRVET